MRFPYSVNLVPSIDSGDEIVLLRPEIPLRVHGPNGAASVYALVDSGADNCIFPLSMAELLGIAVTPGLGPAAMAFGGQRIGLSFADVEIEIIDEEGESLRWMARLYFTDLSQHAESAVIVGHEGFLDYFVATFDGKECELSLQPTDEIPTSLEG